MIIMAMTGSEAIMDITVDHIMEDIIIMLEIRVAK
jgi:hypothetical protein